MAKLKHKEEKIDLKSKRMTNKYGNHGKKVGAKGTLPAKGQIGDVVFLTKAEKVPNEELALAAKDEGKAPDNGKVVSLVVDAVLEKMQLEFRRNRYVADITLDRDFVVAERGESVVRLGTVLSDPKKFESLKDALAKALDKKLKDVVFYFHDPVEGEEDVDNVQYCVSGFANSSADVLRINFKPCKVEHTAKNEEFTKKKDFRDYLSREFENVKESSKEKNSELKEFEDFMKDEL